MKILFYINDLRGGGAERVLSILANEFSKRKHKVIIVTKRQRCDYTLDKKVQWKFIFTKNEIENKRSIIDKILRRISYIPRLIKAMKKEKPDVIISFLINANGKLIFISKYLGTPIIVTEHTNYSNDMNIISWLTRRWIYKLSDAVTILTKYDYDNHYKNFLSNVYIMPNPLSFDPIDKLMYKDKIILAAGSLDRWQIKGFDNLLEIFAGVIRKHSDWKLLIAGSGDEGKKYLLQLAGQLGIRENIEFLGFCKNIDQIMLKSSIFVLTSRYEGFSMVLIEAMSQRCSCISYDCIAGPGEIIRNNFDGILVKNQNKQEMEQGINRLIEDKDLRTYLANNAIKNVQRFSIDRIGNDWLNLINNIINKRKVI